MVLKHLIIALTLIILPWAQDDLPFELVSCHYCGILTAISEELKHTTYQFHSHFKKEIRISSVAPTFCEFSFQLMSVMTYKTGSIFYGGLLMIYVKNSMRNYLIHL